MSIRRRPSIKAIILYERKPLCEYHDNRICTMGAPSGTGATDKIKVITGFGKTGEEWLTVAFAFRVFRDHQPVHNFLNDEQLRKSANTASVCSLVSDRYRGNGNCDTLT